MRVASDWKDYELIDCSAGEKLERWTREILIRPDPQVIWNSPRENRLWAQPGGTLCALPHRRWQVADL